MTTAKDVQLSAINIVQSHTKLIQLMLKHDKSTATTSTSNNKCRLLREIQSVT